ncbi:MAG TPA: hypothetical protein VLM85_08175 [Polyangiaceae bacterium]|nr:hypothetical protein [Polyangiaceae bacterium]
MTFFGRLALLVLPLVVGCGGQIDPGQDGGADGGHPPPTGDAQPPTSDATPPPPVLDGGQCNNLSLLGSSVSINQVPSNPPSLPSGGSAILQGVYVLTELSLYTGPNGQSGAIGQGQITIGVAGSGNVFDFEAVALISSQVPQRTGSTVTISGSNQMTLTTYCPSASGVAPASYYFDGSTLWLRVDSGTQTADEKFLLITN